jgi:hypothetical protein
MEMGGMRMSINEKQFIEAALRENQRIDGRTPFDFRRLVINFSKYVCMYVLFACAVLAPGSSFLNPFFKNSLQAIRKNGKNPLLPRTFQFSFCIINNNSRRIITLVF